jgi:hypothetical protein
MWFRKESDEKSFQGHISVRRGGERSFGKQVNWEGDEKILAKSV